MNTSRLLKIGGLSMSLGLAVIYAVGFRSQNNGTRSSHQLDRAAQQVSQQDAVDIRREALRERRRKNPRSVGLPKLTFWWDEIPHKVRQTGSETGPESNIHRSDYSGPATCQKCHAKNYEQWLQHPHRRMNAVADEENVLGDFSGSKRVDYLGGQATFFRTQGGGYRMQLARDGNALLYEVRQTIGSRFFQYYVGRLLHGAASPESPQCRIDHVLPFGYWLDREEWVPVVHVGSELPDGQREDPFLLPLKPSPGVNFLPYASNCSMCHTTFPLADDFIRKPQQIAKHTPVGLHWHLAAYLRQEHPEIWGELESPLDVSNQQMMTLPEPLMNYEADEHAITLGISCEACHLGCQQHVADPKRPPEFHPRSPHLLVETKSLKGKTGRTHQNVNWTCARCHVGERPQFAGGMATWNSVEYTDAMLGSCYSELKCVDCHSPHQATGKEWSRTPLQDDAVCVRCHDKYRDAEAITAHTHHPVESRGSRCMDCHMPKINEGLQSVVRTHTIFSPTNAAMLEANHPNACNQCHLNKTIDWTLSFLRDWYSFNVSDNRIHMAYPQRDLAVGAGWLKSENEAVRLVAADSVVRTKSREFVPQLIDLLDDPFLVNRQFTQRGLEEMLDVRLEKFGYRFYMTPQERRNVLGIIRAELLNDATDEPASNSPNAATRAD